jgi:hypothetical protein
MVPAFARSLAVQFAVPISPFLKLSNLFYLISFTPEGDVQAETELEIPLEDNKENAKSETKSPKVKTYQKKNLRLQQFPKKSFLKDQPKCTW